MNILRRPFHKFHDEKYMAFDHEDDLDLYKRCELCGKVDRYIKISPPVTPQMMYNATVAQYRFLQEVKAK